MLKQGRRRHNGFDKCFRQVLTHLYKMKSMWGMGVGVGGGKQKAPSLHNIMNSRRKYLLRMRKQTNNCG